jgi:uncharacterized protein (TIGR02145 family)
MKNKIILLSILLLMSLGYSGLKAQNFLISYRAVGLYSSLDSVKIENLTRSTSIVIHGDDVLNLLGTTDINEMQESAAFCRVSPNPMNGDAEVSFTVNQSGVFNISIFDIHGEEIVQLSDYCYVGVQKYTLSGLRMGAYLLKLKGNHFCYIKKIISTNQAQSSINIVKSGCEKQVAIINNSVVTNKGGKSVVIMPFNYGDNMKYTGYKNQCTSIKTDIPASSKTVTFFFSQCEPIVTTANVENIFDIEARCGGHVVSDGHSTVTERGVCWNTTGFPTILDTKTVDGSDTGSFNSFVWGLTANTTYYVRAYATNSVGTAYGNQMVFTTMDTIFAPTITTDSIFNISKIFASVSGTVISDGGSPITSRGICWTDNQNSPDYCIYFAGDSSGMSHFMGNLINLLPNTTYYAKAYADNFAGRGYGNVFQFSTLSPCSGLAIVSDIEGNIYDTIVIGTQCWMKENLKTTRFTDGSTILKVTSDSVWRYQDTSVAAYCWYNNDSISNFALYGALYNWKVVATQNLCPVGWHVPTKNEWFTMEMFLMSHGYNYDDSNYPDYIGKAMASTTNWTFCGDPGTVGNIDYPQKRNATGFTAMPGGRRNYYGEFQNINEDGVWWSSTLPYLNNYSLAYRRSIGYCAMSLFDFNDNIKTGNSVRCIRTIEN